jgi:hypothetical protein
MNITLSVDAQTVQRVREYAARHGTSLNQLVREHMLLLTSTPDRRAVAAEFARLATEHAGRSPDGFVFGRDDCHTR